MANGSIRRQMVVGLLTSSLLATGCTKTMTHQLARYQPTGVVSTTQPVPAMAMYKVKVYGRDGQLHGIDGTERLLQKGDFVGFRTDDVGQVQAIANRDVFALPPVKGRKVVWVGQSTRQTQFGREVYKALNTGAAIAAGAGAMALIGAVAYLESAGYEDEHYCGNTDHKHHKHHRKKH
jgi:hypothetical protein